METNNVERLSLLPTEGLISVKQLAERLGMSPYRVMRRLKKIGIPVVKMGWGTSERLLSLAKINNWLT